MLQVPSPLSRMCGHSHYKKFWLLQTQNESPQANGGSEKSGNLVTSASRCVTTLIGGSDSKHASHGGARSPSTRTLLNTDVPARSPSGVLEVPKHASLVTCVESLSPVRQVDMTRGSSHHTFPSMDGEDRKGQSDENTQDTSEEEEQDQPSPIRSPTTRRSASATSCSCGLPSRDSYRDDPFGNMAESKEPSSTLKHIPDKSAIAMTDRREADIRESDPAVGKGSVFAAKTHYSLVPSPEGDALDSPWDRRGNPCIFLGKNGVDTRHLRSPRKPSNIRGGREHLMKDFRSGKTQIQTESYKRQEKEMASRDAHYDDQEVEECDDTFAEDGKFQELHKCESICGRTNLRTCAHCGTTKTPLWRSGPYGPKSLCNACGIRFKKSRRGTSTVAEGFDSYCSAPLNSNYNRSMSRTLKRKQETNTGSQFPPDDEAKSPVRGNANFYKKIRSPVAFSLKRDGVYQGEDPTGSSGESCLTWNLHSPSSATLSPLKSFVQDKKDPILANVEKINLARIFARDEDEQAAVLLMALSCGLVNA